jgi:riboflavin synthase
MFTGLIESLGTIKQISTRGNYRVLEIIAEPPMENLQPGESIAVGGPCLTVTKTKSQSFTVEASQETLEYTTIGQLHSGSRVNLERALRADARLGGHFVSGHIDTTLPVRDSSQVGDSLQLKIELPSKWRSLITDRGSVSIDGVSLTVIDLDNQSFTVNLIPETQRRTTLPSLRRGNRVNVEFDLIGKVVLRYLETKGSATELNWETLRQLGY